MGDTKVRHVFDQVVAQCRRELAELLLPYDHHRVWVRGRPGVMLTYEWMMQMELPETLPLKVVFPPPSTANAHPFAPPAVQAIIDQLEFSKQEG